MRESIGSCPLCGGEVLVTEYKCRACEVGLKGEFKRCEFCNLPKDLLHFVRVFIHCEGNFREVEKEIGLSYPTIKSRLAKIKQLLDLGSFSQYMHTEKRLELLNRFKDGEINMDDVLKQL
jgi:hypothetical protein